MTGYKRKKQLFKKECIKCNERFTPQTRSSRLCDSCHELALRHKKKPN